MDYVIMDITNGDLVGSVYEIYKEAQEWIDEQDIPSKYDIIERN